MPYILLQINSRRMKNLHTKQKHKFTKKLKETMVNICYKLRIQAAL